MLGYGECAYSSGTNGLLAPLAVMYPTSSVVVAAHHTTCLTLLLTRSAAAKTTSVAVGLWKSVPIATTTSFAMVNPASSVVIASHYASALTLFLSGHTTCVCRRHNHGGCDRYPAEKSTFEFGQSSSKHWPVVLFVAISVATNLH